MMQNLLGAKLKFFLDNLLCYSALGELLHFIVSFSTYSSSARNCTTTFGSKSEQSHLSLTMGYHTPTLHSPINHIPMTYAAISNPRMGATTVPSEGTAISKCYT